MSKDRVLNLGSGELYEPEAINVDFYAEKADIRHDLNVFPYPFKDDTFEEIRCFNIIEHLDDVIAAMCELHRIGKNGCMVTVRVPHFRSACLYEDLTHRHGFAWRSFDIFSNDGAVYGNYVGVRFEIVSRHFTPYKIKPLYDLLSRVPVLTDNLLSKYVPMASIVFVFKVIK